MGVVAKLDVIVPPETGDSFQKAGHPVELTVIERDRFVGSDPTRDGAAFRRRNQRAHEQETLAQSRANSAFALAAS